MVAMVSDAVIIGNGMFAVPGLNHPDAVFNREHRQAPIVIVTSDDRPEAQRINLPVPFRRFQERVILVAKQHIVVDRRSRRDRVAVQCAAGVIAERQIIDLHRRHQGEILRTIDIIEPFRGDKMHHLRTITLTRVGAQQVLV